MKTIWIINQYASTPDVGVGGRHYYLANELAKLGYKVYVIASASSHLLRQQPTFSGTFHVVDVTNSFSFVWVKLPRYEKSSSKQRALNWFLFGWQLQKLTKVVAEKPDVILHSSPSLVPFLGAQRLAKKLSARLVFEVRDIWPLTLVELGGYSRRHPFIQLMLWIERKAYRDSDKVVSNLRNAVDHMVKQGMSREKFSWVPNGVSLEEVAGEVPLDESVKALLPKNKFMVGYTGTIGLANSIDTLIKAADLLKEYLDIQFVLVGSGSAKSELQNMVKERGLNNVTFIDPIPKVQIQAMLCELDICFIGLTKDPLFRFGVSPNKLYDYLYSGKPIIYAIESGAYQPVSELGAGLQVEAESPSAISNAVLSLFSMTAAQRVQMGVNAKKAVLEDYEYGVLAKKLEQVLFG